MDKTKQSCRNEPYFLVGDDAKEFLFSNEMVEEIVTYEKTVEIIGIVQDVELKSKLLKFTVGNNVGDIVQVLVWDEKIINKVKSFIMTGNTVHIDGAYARLKNENLSRGNTKHDLTIMSNTQVTLLRSSPAYKSVKLENPITDNVSIEDALKFEGRIGVIGYIKNVIKETSFPHAKLNQGCLTDCKQYKLEIRMPTVCDMSEFTVGMHVKVIGTIKFTALPYLWVLSKEDIIKISDEKKELENY